MTGIPLESPSSLDPLLKDEALITMSYMVLGCLIKDSSPLVMGKESRGDEFRTSTSITLGSVLTLGCDNILQKFALI